MDETLFTVARISLGAFIAVVCICRAAKMDGRARRVVQWIFVALGGSAVGLCAAPLMEPWMRHACVVAFMASVCALLLDGEQRWRHGTPEDVLRPEERHPEKERREVERRRGS